MSINISQEMSSPHALNKLGYSLGFLGRLTDLVNTVAFEISCFQCEPDSSIIAKWACSLAEAHAIVKHLRDCKLNKSFYEFKTACEHSYLCGCWDGEKKSEMRDKQTELLRNTHRLQSKKLCEYVWTGVILLALIHLIFPLILHHLTG